MDKIYNYIVFLNSLQKHIDSCFEKDKESICCKEKCSMCCSDSYYPVYETEFEAFKPAFNQLDKQIQDEIFEETINIIAERKEFLKTNPDKNVLDFNYKCPLLKDDMCIMYEYRFLTCRTHGLAISQPDKIQLPYCYTSGKNYANTPKENIIPHNISQSAIAKLAHPVPLGDIRTLSEWIFMQIPDYMDLYGSL